MGYFGSGSWRKEECFEDVESNEQNEHTLVGRAMAAVRKEVESMDAFNCAMVLHSLAGGTGSGLGSRLLEALRSAYPRQFVVSAAVAPFVVGETPTQSYNVILASAFIQRYADCCILFHNDDLLRISGSVSSRASVFDGSELVTNIAPHPALKFVDTCTVPCITSTKASSSHLVQQLDSLVRTYDLNHARVQSIATQVTVRADHALYRALNPLANTTRPTPERAKLEHLYPSVPWQPFPYDLRYSPRPLILGGPYSGRPCLTVCSNRSSTAALLDCFLRPATLMYQAGAYMHWYHRFGCSRDMFDQAFEDVARIIDNYTAALIPP